jgi:hypothetical protein
MDKALLDTDTISEITKRVSATVVAKADAYRSVFGYYTLSVLSVIEVVKGYHRMRRMSTGPREVATCHDGLRGQTKNNKPRRNSISPLLKPLASWIGPHPVRAGFPGVPGDAEPVPDCVQVTVDFAAMGPQAFQPPEDAREAFGAGIAESLTQLA